MIKTDTDWDWFLSFIHSVENLVSIQIIESLTFECENTLTHAYTHAYCRRIWVSCIGFRNWVRFQKLQEFFELTWWTRFPSDIMWPRFDALTTATVCYSLLWLRHRRALREYNTIQYNNSLFVADVIATSWVQSLAIWRTQLEQW